MVAEGLSNLIMQFAGLGGWEIPLIIVLIVVVFFGVKKIPELARSFGKATVMIHPQNSWAESLDEVLAVLRAGDIMTHMYHAEPHGILDENGKIRASVRAARERG
jgi:predicted amidohydrolase